MLRVQVSPGVLVVRPWSACLTRSWRPSMLFRRDAASPSTSEKAPLDQIQRRLSVELLCSKLSVQEHRHRQAMGVEDLAVVIVAVVELSPDA